MRRFDLGLLAHICITAKERERERLHLLTSIVSLFLFFPSLKWNLKQQEKDKSVHQLMSINDE